MNSIRNRLTYANVVSTIALFLVLTGATAFAATKLSKGSVGAAQLKAGAVTAAKLRNGAVTAEKLADRSVGAADLAKGSVTPEKLAAPSALPVVRRTGGTGSLEFPFGTQPAKIFPVANLTDLQPAGEDDLYVASITVKIPASCPDHRAASAFLFVDRDNGQTGRLIGRASIENNFSGDEVVTAPFVPGGASGGNNISLAPLKPTTHSFEVELIRGSCRSITTPPSGILATGVQIDVIGLR